MIERQPSLTNYYKCSIIGVMKNIRIIKTGIDVSAIQAQLDAHPQDWGNVGRMKGTGKQDPHTKIVTSEVLQLVMGGVSSPNEFVGDTEISMPTDATSRHTEIQRFLGEHFTSQVGRCAFLKTPIGQITGKHIDQGTYYLTKDRYHLSITGTYRYTVWDNGEDDTTKEVLEVEPGTLFWFNNKKNHMAENTSKIERIAFIFDVPQSPSNP